MDPRAARLAGACAIVSFPVFLLAGALDGALLVAAPLLVVPGVAALGHALRGRSLPHAGLATASLGASFLLWAAAALLGAWWLEPGYLALSALGWLAFVPLLGHWPRWFLWLTALVGAFAASDALVTLLEEDVPFLVFALLGGPKIPLQFAWQVGLGVLLLKGRPAPRAAR